MKKTICLIISIIVIMLFILWYENVLGQVTIKGEVTWDKFQPADKDTNAYLRIYRALPEPIFLLKDKIDNDSTRAIVYIRLDSLINNVQVGMTAYDPTNNDSCESAMGLSKIWHPFGMDSVPPAGIAFRPLEIVYDKPTLMMTINIIMGNYDNFEIDLKNTLNVPITSFKFELSPKGYFDWVNIDGKKIESLCLSADKCNEDGIHEPYFEYTKIIPPGETIIITGDIDESETDGFLDPIVGEISVNGHSGRLEKVGNDYICEIRY